ncbi:MAG: MMPL family transporter, partial [Planctomycetota bacterium]|nr:MMPL family transporter [Planctomycetota bacterium]
GLAMVAVSIPLARQLRFDQSIEALYAAGDTQLLDYLESKSLFGGDEFVILAFNDPGLFREDGVTVSDASAKHLREFAGQLNRIEGVNAASTQQVADAMKSVKLLRFIPNGTAKVRRMVDTVLVGPDGDVASIILRLKPETPDLPRGETIARIREVADSQPTAVAIVGEPVQIHDMFRYVENDGAVLFQVSVALLAGVIFLFFSSVRWMLLPLIVVMSTIVWTQALLVVSAVELSMVSSMLNSLSTIISVATVTHITVRFREHRAALDRVAALRVTFAELLPAITWTCGTTAIGFAALLSSRILPVQSFGLMMAMATGLVLVATVVLLPGGILLGEFQSDPHVAYGERILGRFLGGITDGVDRFPKSILAGFALIIVVSLVGLGRMTIQTDFSKNFRESTPLVQSLRFVEERLGGAGTLEVNFPAPKALTDKYLDRVRRVTDRLRQLESTTGLTKVASITDGLELVPEIPFFLGTVQKRLDVIRGLQPEFESSLYNSKRGRMRILLRAREQQSAEDKNRLIESVQAVTEQEFPDAKVTGIYVLLTFIIDSLLVDQTVSFVIAAAGIAIMMTVAFRSFRIGLICLIPNAFPILIVIGILGWLNEPINLGTAMIASVSLGLTVDSSIHYISGYRRARRVLGLNHLDALRATHQGVGRALVFANMALIAGFSVLTLSSFVPLIYFGVLVSVAMIGGLIGNLVLLPILLKWAERVPSTSRKTS